MFVAFLFRIFFYLFFVSGNPVEWKFDSRVYRLVAERILAGFGLTNNDGSAHFYRLPGYPFFLAVAAYLNGFEFAILFQIILASLIPLLIYFYSKSIFENEDVAIFSAMFSVIHVGFIILSSVPLSDSVFLLFK